MCQLESLLLRLCCLEGSDLIKQVGEMIFVEFDTKLLPHAKVMLVFVKPCLDVVVVRYDKAR